MTDGSHSNPTLTVGTPDLAALRELTRGQTVGRYLLLDKVGEGGMGAVWAAYDQELDRRVALKVLLAQATPSTTGTQKQARLMREAQSLARLSHPNVVAIHDVFTWEGEVVVVMELVDGQNVRIWLRETPRSWEQVVAVFAAAGEGLAAAHQKGIVHRDFKPDNILVGADGRVRVADFGIARSVEDVSTGEVPTDSAGVRAAMATSGGGGATPTGRDGAPATGSATGPTNRIELTLAGQVIGTPPYLAPELFRGEAASPRSDQFSFGVSLFEALVGYRPFAGSFTDRLSQIARGELAPLPPQLKLPSFVLDLLTRSVAEKPAARFPDMGALLFALRRDPAQTRRRVVAGIAVLVGLCAVGFGVERVLHERGMLCTGGPAELGRVWNDGVRAQLARSFAATRVPFAEDALRLVNETLDARGQEWVRTHREACVASRVRGEQSDDVLSRRMACLSARLEETRALTSVFSDIDAKGVERTARVLDGLSPVADCSDLKMLLAQVKAPATASARKAVDALRPELADAWVLNNVGRYPESKGKVEALTRRARPIGYAPFEAELSVLSAVNAERLGAKDEIDLALAAVKRSESAGDDRLVIKAANLLALVHIHRGHPAQAHEWLDFAEAAIERVGGAPEQEVIYLSHLTGLLLDLEGNANAARVTVEKALRIAYEKLGRDHTTTYYARDAYAIVLEALGQTLRSVEEQRSLIKDMSARLGVSHPSIANPYNSLAEALMTSGQYPLAKDALERAQGLLQANAMDQSLLHGYVLATSARVAQLTGDESRSAALNEAAAAFFIRFSGADYPQVPAMQAYGAAQRAKAGEPDAALATLLGLKAKVDLKKDTAGPGYSAVYASLARVEVLIGQSARAVEHVKLALGALKSAGSSVSSEAGEASETLGRAELELGKAAEAREAFEAEREMWTRLGGESHPSLAFAHGGLGEAAVLAQRPAEARRELEAALLLFDPQPGTWLERASARFALARLVATEDPARARALARAAKEELARRPKLSPSLGHKIDAFLAH